MKNLLFMVAAIAGTWAVALACPAQLRERVMESAQIPEHVQLEADRQLEMFVSWVRDDTGRPVEDIHQRDLN